MLPSPGLAGAVIEGIETALEAVVAELSAGRIEQEPDFTSQFVGELRGELRRAHIDGYRWRIKVLTDRGPGAQERKFGADLLVVQHIQTPEYTVSKGFLAQAKLAGKRVTVPDLVRQCDDMLAVTPEAFVLLYSTSGIQVASASAVSAAGGALFELRQKSLRDFLEDLLTSWVGDRRLDAADADRLEELRVEYGARAAVGAFVEPVVF